MDFRGRPTAVRWLSQAVATSGVWMSPAGGFVRLTSGPRLDAHHPEWSPDGARIAYSVFEGCFRCSRIYAIPAVSGDSPELLADGPRSGVWSPDGSLLLTSYPVTLVTVGTGRVQAITSGTYASWAPDGTEFAFFGFDQPTGIYVSPLDRPRAPACLALPDGARLSRHIPEPSLDRGGALGEGRALPAQPPDANGVAEIELWRRRAGLVAAGAARVRFRRPLRATFRGRRRQSRRLSPPDARPRLRDRLIKTA